MDLIACIKKLRPNTIWLNNIVNAHDLGTISETYQNLQPIPTLEECEAVWETIQIDTSIEYRCDEVDTLRELKLYKPFVYNSINWDVRPFDLINIIGRKSYARDSVDNPVTYPWSGSKTSWRDRDNIDQTFLTAQSFIDFAVSVHDHVTNAFANAMVHKDALRLLTDHTDIQDYDITTGW